MNNRIRDLALEAIVENISAPAWVFTDAELEKFAELIIQECCDAVRYVEALEIKNHFGVKE
jgi:hypothetical protein